MDPVVVSCARARPAVRSTHAIASTHCRYMIASSPCRSRSSLLGDLAGTPTRSGNLDTETRDEKRAYLLWKSACLRGWVFEKALLSVVRSAHRDARETKGHGAHRVLRRASTNADRRLYRHPESQEMFGVLPGIENDLHGNPLDDLHVVAGRVLRREQAVACAACPRNI